MNSWISGDLHWGHKNVGKYRGELGITTERENIERISDEWVANIREKDLVNLIGDCAFTIEACEHIKKLPGHKRLVMGNHDIKNTKVLSETFYEVCSSINMWGYIVTHIPILRSQLRHDRPNVHAHLHFDSFIEDGPMYFGVSCDRLKRDYGKFFLSAEECKRLFSEKQKEYELCNLSSLNQQSKRR